MQVSEEAEAESSVMVASVQRYCTLQPPAQGFWLGWEFGLKPVDFIGMFTFTFERSQCREQNKR